MKPTLATALALGLFIPGCGGAAVEAPTPSSPRSESVPPPTAETVEAWIEELRMEEETPATLAPPAGATVREGVALSTFTSPDGRTVGTRHANGFLVHASLEGPPTPAGLRVRVIPVLSPSSFPHHALLLEGSDAAIPFHSGGGALPFHVPLRRPPPGHEHALDADALDATLRLAHFNCRDSTGSQAAADADAEENGCFYYGREPELAGVTHRPTGWWVLAGEPPIAPVNAVWGERWEGGPDNRYLTDPRTATRELAPEGPEFDWEWTLFAVKIGDTWVDSLVSPYSPDEVGISLHLVAAGDVVFVVLTYTDWGGIAFSRHDARTGAPVGDPVAVGIGSMGDGHGIASIGLSITLLSEDPRGPFGVVMGAGSFPRLFVPPFDGEGEWVAYDSPPAPSASETGENEGATDDDYDYDYEDATPVILRLDRSEGVPRVRPFPG